MPAGSLSGTRRSALFSGLALALELASPLALAATVTSCDDSATAPVTPGTLRYEVANAADGATVDFNLPGACNSTITLETAALAVAQNSLTIQGPAGGYITLRNDLNGAYNGGTQVTDRVIAHSGTGTLTLTRLHVSQGYFPNFTVQGRGGCIYSAANVVLSHTTVSDCHLLTLPGAQGDPTRYGSGAGIATKGTFKSYYSTIEGNIAATQDVGGKYGLSSCGGVDAGGGVLIVASTISDNQVITATGNGGGLCLAAGGVIESSTISGNSIAPAPGQTYTTTLTRGGGIFAAAAAGQSLLLLDSTVSGNTAGALTGGVHAALPTGVLASTIAFNTAGQGKDGSGAYVAPGLALLGAYSDGLTDALVAYNTYGTVPSDFSAYNVDKDSGPKATLQGNNNLIVFPRQGVVPPYTITFRCPRLDRLRDNGGPTKTHALLSYSPALDEGSVINLGFGDLASDQRFLPRTSGLFPDIGAYEAQKDDLLFSTNFEQCSALTF